MEIARNKPIHRLLALLLAAAVLVVLVVPALAEMEWPTKIQRFEHNNPAYTQVVEIGTAKADLKLPETLRAVIPLDELELDGASFVQAQPEVDLSDGYTHYDYYSYGYVAPKHAEELYAAGEKAIYTIYYADREDPRKVGEVAYRLFGSMGGSENLWFACDEAGAITGVVLDIPVTWSDGGYDPATPGEYTFTASFSGYTYGQARPFAKITVEELAAEEGCTCGAAEGEAHGEDCPLHLHSENENSADCTCGAQPDETGKVAHAADCPLYEKEIHCSCAVGEDAYSDQHGLDCPYFEKEELRCTCAQQTNEKGDRHDLTCPCYLRLAVDCHCGPEGEAIDADNFPWAHQEDCIHFSPIECMCREMVETIETITEEDGSTREETMLVPGAFSHVHDPNNTDCPLYGRDTVTIQKLDTTSLSAQLMGGTTSVMAKEDAEQIVAMQETAQSEAAKGVEGTLPQDPPAAYSLETEKVENVGEPGVLYPALGKIEIVQGSEIIGNSYDTGMELLSINGGGANDTAQDNTMRSNTPTAENSSYQSEYTQGVVIPGEWTDYVNTIWMNKAYNTFAWTSDTDTKAYKGWSWSGATATLTASGTNTVTTNAKVIPTKVSSAWTVYSGEQLRYALKNLADGDTVTLGGNINLKGSAYQWDPVSLGLKSMVFNGNKYTIYNAGMLPSSSFSYSVYTFIGGYNNFNCYDLSFCSAKLVFTEAIHAGVFAYGNANQTSGYQQISFTNVNISKSMIYSSDSANGRVSPFGTLAPQGSKSPTRCLVTKCNSTENYVYGVDHISGFSLGLGNPADTALDHGSQTTYSTVTEALLCGTGGHSSGFSSCIGGNFNLLNCFASIEMYGSAQVSGFRGGATGSLTSNCFATGKLEGYESIAGFTFSYLSENARVFSNCYTTVLCGLRTKGNKQAGFGITSTTLHENYKDSFGDCYAAGEVGNYDINHTEPKTIGGFLAQYATQANGKWQNCYYDKQTTAMREWAAGDSKSVTGVTGILTTGLVNSSGQKVNGLTDDPTAAGAGTLGFTGFSDNTQWVYQGEHYPQLNVFANASSTEWGSAETANLVRAYSLASTSTVMLNTWDKGYDWDDTGVRTAAEVSYDRTLASTGKTSHKGYEYTYDTVREIIAPFAVTGNASYSHMVGSGAPSMAGSTQVTNTVTIDDAAKTGKTENPGMDWYRISASSGGQTGFRPIRLIGYIGMDAGTSKTVLSGQKYDHKQDVGLTMMDTLTDNLVVGMDDSKIWSTSKSGGYPNSKKFWAVPTTNMETGFSASKDAWLYTEIWRARQNPDGSYVQDTAGQYGYTDGTNKLVPDISVKVTGTGTGSNLTLDEQKWNGELPLYPDTSVQRKYIVSYYWMLADGRYATDYKVITIEPGQYDLTLDVRSMQSGAKTDPADSGSLYLGTGEDNLLGDLGYTLSGSTASHAQTQDIGYTKNAAAGWKKLNSDILVVKTQIDLYANDDDKTLMGTATVDGELKAGSTITIPTDFYYYTKEYDAVQGADREVTKLQRVDVTYTVMEKADGGGKGTGEYYLRFNKLANVPADEIPSASAGTNDAGGIPPEALAYINDTQFNTEITLWVRSGTDFTFIKTDEDGNPFGAGEATFQLYSCTHTHNAYCGGLIDPNACNHYHKVDGSGAVIAGQDNHAQLATNSSQAAGCWAVEGPTVLTAQTDGSGKVLFEKLASGDYILAETGTKSGYQLPQGQWLLHVDAAAGTVGITARGETPPAFKVETTGAGAGAVATLKLPNYPILTMPHAGGMGTILFTVGGIALIGVAVIVLIATRKKKGGDKEKGENKG